MQSTNASVGHSNISSESISLEKAAKDGDFYNNYLHQIPQYSPQPYQGKVSLILSTEWKYEDLSFLKSLVSEQLDVHLVRSLHNSLFNPPFINELVKALQKCLADKGDEP